MLFQNTKNISLKVSVSPISDLWKIFQISLAHEFIGKKAKLSRDTVLEFWSSWASCSEKDRQQRLLEVLDTIALYGLMV